MASEWAPVPFGELLTEPVRNGIYKSAEFHGRGAKIVNMGELFAHSRMGSVPMKRVELTESEQERFMVQAGDLLFARRSLTAEGAGKCSVVLEVDGPTTFESSIIRARPDQGRADPQFLYYFFSSPSGMHLLDTIRRHVAVAGITGADLARLEIPLPPLGEQSRIVAILSSLDDKIELNRKMSQTLEAMARALFKSWFVDFDPVRAKAEGRGTGLPEPIDVLFPSSFEESDHGEIPSGWAWTPLPEAIEVNPPRELKKGAVAPYLDMANAPTKGHSVHEVVDRVFGSGMRFVNGDTLLARITPCLENGKTAYVDFLQPGQVGWGSTEFIVLRPKSPLPAEYGYCLARSGEFRAFAIQSMTGSSGRQRVPAEALSNFFVAMPRAAVALEFGRITELLLRRAKACAEDSRSLVGCRDALLQELTVCRPHRQELAAVAR